MAESNVKDGACRLIRFQTLFRSWRSTVKDMRLPFPVSGQIMAVFAVKDLLLPSLFAVHIVAESKVKDVGVDRFSQ